MNQHPKPCPPPVRPPVVADPDAPHALTFHVMRQASRKGIALAAVQAAADDHDVQGPAKGHGPGFVRRVRDGVAVVVDVERRQVVTVYLHGVRTALRSDQVPASA